MMSAIADESAPGKDHRDKLSEFETFNGQRMAPQITEYT
jgi:hypothetical protein